MQIRRRKQYVGLFVCFVVFSVRGMIPGATAVPQRDFTSEKTGCVRHPGFRWVFFFFFFGQALQTRPFSKSGHLCLHHKQQRVKGTVPPS